LRIRLFCGWVLAGVALTGEGCRQADVPAPPDPAQAARASKASARSPSTETAADSILDADDLKRLAAAQQSKVVLLDFWATWCEPCVEGLPELARLRKRHSEADLFILPVSFDDTDVWERQAIPVLRRAGWAGPQVIIRDRRARDALVTWLARRWRGELPAQFIIGRDGTVLVERLAINSSSMPSLEAQVESAVRGGS